MRSGLLTAMVVLSSVWLSGCSDPEPVSIGVELRTDLAPGDEFAAVQVRLAPARDPETAIRETSEDIAPGRDLTAGRRISLFEGLERGDYRLDVSLVTLDGSPVVTRRVVANVQTSVLLTVVITRSCANVGECPGADDPPNATTCRGGECVDPRCRVAEPDYCPAPMCTRDADCTDASGDCGVCISGVCLYPPVATGRDAGTCSPDGGPSCSDGTMNGDETGIDCGGSCPRGCAWVEAVDPGCPTTSELPDQIWDTGPCADRDACDGCDSLSGSQCRDHCLDVAESLGRDVTCELTGCSTECKVYEGNDREDCGGDAHPMWFAHAP